MTTPTTMQYVIFFALLLLEVAYVSVFWKEHISKALKESDGVMDSIKRHITWIFSMGYLTGFILEVVNIHISATVMGTMAAVVFATVGGAITEKLVLKKIASPIPDPPAIINTGDIAQQNNTPAEKTPVS